MMFLEPLIEEMLLNQVFAPFAERIVKANVKPGYPAWLAVNFFIPEALGP
jgi:hypothetical protein